jgi:hypothetical protein
MRNSRVSIRFVAVLSVFLLLAGLAAPQIRELIKVVGVAAAVRQLGPEMNRGFNRLTGHTDTPQLTTRVVPILSLGGHGAIGAAQIMGPRDAVRRTVAVFQPEVQMFGNEVRLRGLIPIASEDLRNIRRVNGVAVTGIVDLRL